jgi:cholesterol transport system auxiliary component
MRAPALIAAVLLLGACSLTGPSRAPTYYLLEDRGGSGTEAHPGATAWPGVVLVPDTVAGDFYQDSHLAYSLAPGTRGHYQFARYTGAPGPRIAELLRQRLERAGPFQGVAGLGNGVVGDYQLNTRLLDLYHDAASAPGKVRLELEAELVARQSASLLARTRISTSAPAASHDAAGAAAASDAALALALDRLVDWLERVRMAEGR